MANRRKSAVRDFWRPRIEGQILDTIRAHPEWFNASTESKASTIVASLAKSIVGEIVAVELFTAATSVTGGDNCSQPGVRVVESNCDAPAEGCVARAPRPDAELGTEPTAPLSAVEVRRNADGSLDEIVSFACTFHLEQMGDEQWWMGITKDGYRQVVRFGVHNGRLLVDTECDDWPDNPGEAARAVAGYAFLAASTSNRRLGLFVRTDIVALTVAPTRASCLNRAQRTFSLNDSELAQRGRVVPVLIVPQDEAAD